MAEVRVRLPLGALNKQDVGKPGIPRASGARDRRFKSGRPDCDCGGVCVGTGRRLLSVTSQVRFLPPQLYGRASQLAMAAAPKAVELHSLEGSTPSPSACTCPWPIGRGTSLPSWTGGFDSRRALCRMLLSLRGRGFESRPSLCWSDCGVVSVGRNAWL